MSLVQGLESVPDPISTVAFRIIHKGNKEDHSHLERWAKSILDRLEARDTRKFVTLVIDCQGALLGQRARSGLSLQVAEIYEDNFDIFNSCGTCPPVNPKPGFIILMPFDMAPLDALSRVLSHERIALVTFDFTADVAVLQEERLSVNLNRLIDCQLGQTHAKRGEILIQTKCPPMSSLLKRKPVDPLFTSAEAYLAIGAPIQWDARYYVMEHDQLPKSRILDSDFLENAVAQIALTGLLCTCIIQDPWKNRQGSSVIQCVVQQSQYAVREFRENSGRDRKPNPLRGAVRRKMAFASASELYTDPPNVIGDDEKELARVLRIWRLAYEFECALGIYPETVPLDPGLHRRRKEAADHLLRPKIEQIRDLAAFAPE
jgi:hypothetical protein